jgi:hypothetical protein
MLKRTVSLLTLTFLCQTLRERIKELEDQKLISLDERKVPTRSSLVSSSLVVLDVCLAIL